MWLFQVELKYCGFFKLLSNFSSAGNPTTAAPSPPPATTSVAPPPPPVTTAGNICSDPFGFYANPADSQCQSFIQCAHGTPHVIPCGAGLVYNPNTIQCTWPSEYQCPGSGGNPTTTAAPPPPATTSGAPPPSPVTTAPSPPVSTTTGVTPPPPPPGPLSKRVVCYYPNWSYYRQGTITTYIFKNLSKQL